MTKSITTARLTRCSISALLVFLLPALAFSQTGSTGALAGIVTDSRGAVLAEVHVEAKNIATAETRMVVTQLNGSYAIPFLPPGTYRLEFSSSGFKLAVKPLVQISVTETARLDVSLEPGGVQEQVTVSTDSALLQTESATLGRVTDRGQVSNLPLATRNFTQIIGLSPGIAMDVNNATELGRGTGGIGLVTPGGIRAHGAFARDNNFQMNGLPINDLHSAGLQSGGIAIPNPDAIQEFKVQTALFDAAYGRNAGANVNVVTRSGGNGFHGGVFEFLRNDALDANDFFRNRAGQHRGVLQQNQFGFVLGGPLKKDKLLFFGSYQGTRQINGVGPGGSSSVFSTAFSDDRSAAALGALFAGQRGLVQTQLGGVGPAIAADGSNISAPALALLNLKLPNGQYVIPTPQVISPAQPFNTRGFSAFSEPARFNEDQFLINLDFIPTNRSIFAGRFFYVDNSHTVCRASRVSENTIRVEVVIQPVRDRSRSSEIAIRAPGCKLRAIGCDAEMLLVLVPTWQVIGDDGRATAFGNSGVGVVTGPGQRNWDISLLKRTPIRKLGESGNFEFRAEFFNAFNTPQFANPGTNVSAANFGVISATSVNPRVVQLAFKINF